MRQLTTQHREVPHRGQLILPARVYWPRRRYAVICPQILPGTRMPLWSGWFPPFIGGGFTVPWRSDTASSRAYHFLEETVDTLCMRYRINDNNRPLESWAGPFTGQVKPRGSGRVRSRRVKVAPNPIYESFPTRPDPTRPDP